MREKNGPLEGLRVLEHSTGIGARTTGCLLADLGADVVRVLPDPHASRGPDDISRDRGKRYVVIPPTGEQAVPEELLTGADVLIDETAGNPSDVAAGEEGSTTPVRIHMPPYGSRNRWRDLPGDGLLLDGVSGFASRMASTRPGTPVATVLPVVESLQGALGAVAALAGVRDYRRTGRRHRLEVNGLHGAAAALLSLAAEGLDVERIHAVGGRIPGMPNFRAYRCSDGRYLHLAALTVDFFLPALEVLDRMDVMVLPGVDGEFVNLQIGEVGDVVGKELEVTFATRPRDEWLTLLATAGVPCAPVRSQDEWLGDEIVADAAPPVAVDDPEFGKIVMPGPAITFSTIPARVGSPPIPFSAVPPGEVWPEPRRSPAVQDDPAPAAPLADLTVVDISTFLAGPFTSSLLADLGASVVKVEPPRGDPYSVFTIAYAAVNQAKSIGYLDLRSEQDRTALLDLLSDTDVLVDNLRPAAADRLGLSDDVLSGAGGPGLVRASVSAFGRNGSFADLPGFDPVLQALSGMSAAQGGDDEPTATSSPVVDAATGALTAVGVLAALIAREAHGHGQHVTTSLAGTSTFLELAELTAYEGRPPMARGGRDYRGPAPEHRYYATSDGWLAVAATSPTRRAALTQVLRIRADDPAGFTVEAEATFATRTTENWLEILGTAGVPAAAVVPRDGGLHDPELVAEEFSHIIRESEFGRFRITRGFHRDLRRGSAPAAQGWPHAEQMLTQVGTLHPGFEVLGQEKEGNAP